MAADGLDIAPRTPDGRGVDVGRVQLDPWQCAVDGDPDGPGTTAQIDDHHRPLAVGVGQ